MPKINDINITVRSKDKTEFYYKANASVGTENGIFSVALDTRLEQSAIKLANAHSVGLESTAKNNWRVTGKSLNIVVDFIHLCADDFLSAEEIVERVIIYGHNIDVSFYEAEGEIYPNGVSAVGTRKGNWYQGGDLNSNRHVEFYSVGFAAVVYDKTIFRRSSGDTVRYVKCLSDNDPDVAALNGFIGIHIELRDIQTSKKFRVMPYTPQAAQYFYSVMLNVCKLAKQIESFFGDPASVERAIASGTRFQLQDKKPRNETECIK